jgi:GAF domain-containing protein
MVVPIFTDGSVVGVLDVDSDRLDDFSDVDRSGLENIVKVLERSIQSHTNSERIE